MVSKSVMTAVLQAADKTPRFASASSAPPSPSSLLVDLSSLSRESLAVAQENYKASTPPLRNIDVTAEIMTMLRTSPVRKTLAKRFGHAPEHPPILDEGSLWKSVEPKYQVKPQSKYRAVSL